jgi:hypothetical protein
MVVCVLKKIQNGGMSYLKIAGIRNSSELLGLSVLCDDSEIKGTNSLGVRTVTDIWLNWAL